ncbi:histidine phosphatase superfamily [Nemania sp. FL0031]|nr:histidine phosphatase superfamily [Nemania sp. FL0031]
MPPTIHIIRHGHAQHQDHPQLDIPDPELTEVGIKECEKLAADMAKLGNIELVLASPMKRTIQTAIAAFPSYLQSKQILLLPDLQEQGVGGANTGSSREDLIQQFGTEYLDYTYVKPGWTDRGPGSRYDIRAVHPRAEATRLWIRAVAQHYRDTNAHIAVVTHSFYATYLMPPDYSILKNAEWRSCRFDDIVGGDGQATLHELPCSVTRRYTRTEHTYNYPHLIPDEMKMMLATVKEREEREKPPCCSPGGEHETFCPLLGSKPQLFVEKQQTLFDDQQPTSHNGQQTLSELFQTAGSSYDTSSTSSLSRVNSRALFAQQATTNASLPGSRSPLMSPTMEEELRRLTPICKATKPQPLPDGTIAWNAYMQKRALEDGFYLKKVNSASHFYS